MKKTYLLTFILVSTQFVFGQFDPILNGGFEIWEDDTIYMTPDNWGSSNTAEYYGISAVSASNDAADGDSSIRLEAIGVDTDVVSGFVFQGTLGPSGPEAGVPYSENFEAINVSCKADLATGDTLFMLMIRYSFGSIVDYDLMPVMYGSSPVWTPNLLYVGNTPQDSLFISFLLNNPATGQEATPGSWAMVDNIQFYAGASTTTPITNHSFENWTATTTEVPSDWYTLNPYLSGFGVETATKTTDAFAGNYAIEMETILSGQDSMVSLLSLAPIDIFNPPPFNNAEYNGNPAYFSGAYKYAPNNGDQAGIQIQFFENGVNVGTHYEVFSAQTEYTVFSSPLTITGSPDSVLFVAYSGENPGSVLKLDNLQFGANPVSVGLDDIQDNQFMLYPNPATASFSIAPNNLEKYSITLLTTEGKRILRRNHVSGIQHIQTDHLTNGVYLIHIHSGQERIVKKTLY